MKAGDNVRINVEEPEYMPYHGQVGTIEEVYTNGYAVRFADGQLCYFNQSEVEETE